MQHNHRRSRGCSHSARAIAALAASFASSHASAGFTSMLLQRYAVVETASGTKSVYRIYAQFTEPGDRAVSWGGSPQFPTTIQTMRCSVQMGSAFYQAPNGGNTAPYQADIDADPDTRWVGVVALGWQRTRLLRPPDTYFAHRTCEIACELPPAAR